ncbi:hypothetical protein [Pectobacterium fontis]|uniref:hypothetical protein n=1 Tax=Pectobacterium fontis TaxID=2558042 RepID=UPI000ADF044D|nr:hypothetical protein [Pectobacterium fontis]
MSHLTHLSHFPHIAARLLRFPARHSGGMFGGNSTLSDEVMSQGTIAHRAVPTLYAGDNGCEFDSGIDRHDPVSLRIIHLHCNIK